MADDSDTVDIIARALVEKFGDDAIKVAMSQAEAASVETPKTWRAVVLALTIH